MEAVVPGLEDTRMYETLSGLKRRQGRREEVLVLWTAESDRRVRDGGGEW